MSAKISTEDKKIMEKALRIVPDTSIIIEGTISKKIEKQELRPNTILIHEAVMAELESKGIRVILYEFEKEEKPFILTKYFDETTMSIHIKENCPVRAKKGKPGDWMYVDVDGGGALDREAVKELAKAIVEEASGRTDSFIEVERKGSSIVQFMNYRIVITRPPFADGYEITAVRPIKKLALSDYSMSEKIMNRIEAKAEGILIAGAPGHGRTTFGPALAG